MDDKILNVDKKDALDQSYIRCRYCGISTYSFDTEAEAIKEWNRRAQ